MCIEGDLPDPVTPGVWWRDDTVWCRYKEEHADLIKQAFRNGDASVILEGILGPDCEDIYTVDLRSMQQRSPEDFLRPVLIVDAAAGPHENRRLSWWVIPNFWDCSERASHSVKSGNQVIDTNSVQERTH